MQIITVMTRAKMWLRSSGATPRIAPRLTIWHSDSSM